MDEPGRRGHVDGRFLLLSELLYASQQTAQGGATMQAMFRGLPDNFDPEEYEVAEGKPLSQFLGDDEGVTVLGVRVAKRQKKSADSPDGGTGDAGTGDAGAG